MLSSLLTVLLCFIVSSLLSKIALTLGISALSLEAIFLVTADSVDMSEGISVHVGASRGGSFSAVDIVVLVLGMQISALYTVDKIL